MSPIHLEYPSTPNLYTLSLHDALPISPRAASLQDLVPAELAAIVRRRGSRLALALKLYDKAIASRGDRKSTRLNSSHPSISYAVFCLKQKTKDKKILRSLGDDPIA